MALRYGGVFKQDNIKYLISSAALGGNFEGDYTAWTLKWNGIIPNKSDADEIDYNIDERYNVINIEWDDEDGDFRWGTFNLSDFSTIFLSPAGADYGYHYPYNWMGGMQIGKAYFYYGGISKSIQTYLLLHRADYYTNEVWRGGILLWARDLRDDVSDEYPEAETGMISLSGKYILLTYWGDDGNYRIVLYEGGTAV